MRLVDGLVGSGMNAGRCDHPDDHTAVVQFNAIYNSYPSYYGTRVSREFSEFLANRPVDSLSCLDLGAGQGRYSLYLARAGARVRAVDRSWVAMAQLACRAGEERLAISTEVADLCGYDFEVAGYDLVVCSTVLDHLDESCRRRLAASISGALRPGGVVYCEVFTTSDPGWCGLTEQLVSETAGPVRHYFATGELCELFSELTILTYMEVLKNDRAHGVPHRHGLAMLVGLRS